MRETPLIVLILATRIEAEPFVEALRLRKTADTPLPTYAGDGITLVISGIGKSNAAMAATYCCTTFRPAWIVNLGAAGAMKTSYALGDVFHITRVIEWDRPLLSSKGRHVHQPQVLPGFRGAILATQDRPVIDRDQRTAIEPYAGLADMEGAAVVQVARKFGTPCVLFKFVSDTPEDESDADILAHIKEYAVSFCRFVTESVFPALEKGGAVK